MLSRIDSAAHEPRAYTSRRHLIQLNTACLHKVGLKVVHALTPQSGVTRSDTLGRGVEFAELKPYQPGDDTRHMDWRATARTDTPWVKAFEADQQRLITCVVDQTSDLLFGSEVFTKSAVAAELAALCCWDHLALGYTANLLIQTDSGLNVTAAIKNSGGLASCLQTLADCNQVLRPFDVRPNRNHEKVVLDYLSRQTQKQDVFWFSSATQWQAASVAELAMLGRYHVVHLVLIDDPLDTDAAQLQGFDLVGPRGRHLATSDYNEEQLRAVSEDTLNAHNSLIEQLNLMGVRVYHATSVQDAREQYHSQRGFGRFEA